MDEQPPIEEITRKIVESLHPTRVVLFGSRARRISNAVVEKLNPQAEEGW